VPDITGGAMEELHNVYIQKGHDSNVYEMYSFKALDTAATLRNCASRFGLVAFIVSMEANQPSTHYVKRCKACRFC
jgi:hypothetical protein